MDGEQLDTLMVKCEGIVNARPITSVSDDPNDLEALTPNHLLLMRGSQLPSRGEEDRMPGYQRRWARVHDSPVLETMGTGISSSESTQSGWARGRT